jgi:hypothetical protein
MQKSFRYTAMAKNDVPKNPIVLDKRIAGGIFWSMATIVAGMIVIAIYWLLAHPIA